METPCGEAVITAASDDAALRRRAWLPGNPETKRLLLSGSGWQQPWPGGVGSGFRSCPPLIARRMVGLQAYGPMHFKLAPVISSPGTVKNVLRHA